jgi:mannitol-1-phosphate/altronate dehydrogenase
LLRHVRRAHHIDDHRGASSGRETPDLSSSIATARRVVHFGVGNFHRSHQALYVEEMIENASFD